MRTPKTTGQQHDAAMTAYEEEVLRSLRRIIRAVDLYSRKLVSETGLSGPQLICLRELEAQGAMQTNHLAKAVNLSPATVCGILDRLELRALVVRERQRDDKRRVLVSLSERGRAVTAAAPPPLHESFLFKLRALPHTKQAEINEILKTLVSMIAADELDAAPILIPGDSVTPGPGTKP